jgi:hypothetical protein
VTTWQLNGPSGHMQTEVMDISVQTEHACSRALLASLLIEPFLQDYIVPGGVQAVLEYLCNAPAPVADPLYPFQGRLNNALELLHHLRKKCIDHGSATRVVDAAESLIEVQAHYYSIVHGLQMYLQHTTVKRYWLVCLSLYL